MFAIVDDTYRYTTLKVLSTIDMDRRLVTFDSSISFQLFYELQTQSYTELTILMGLYGIDFTATQEYEQLLIDYP